MTKSTICSLVAFVFGTTATVYVWFGERSTIDILTREDGIVEYLSVIFYLVALIVCFIALFKNDRRILPLVWAILCFMFIGEETSWFQRLFQYSVPWVEQANVQKEFNLHNLHIFQSGKLTSSSIELSDFLEAQNLFRIGFFGYFIVLPFFLHIPISRRFLLKIGYKKPDTHFMVVLILVLALSFTATIFCPLNVKRAMAETREMLYALFIMVYVIIYIRPNEKIKQTV